MKKTVTDEPLNFPRVFSLGYDMEAVIGCSVESGTCYIWPYGGDLAGSLPPAYDLGMAWVHVAVCREGPGNTKLFIDGALVATYTGDDNANINDAGGFDLNIGVDSPSGVGSSAPNWWAGRLTNFRWDNSAVYTGTSLTVPTSPLSATVTTKLLLLGGTVNDPVYDSTNVNFLVNNEAEWSPDTPFVS
jgi:hypothetical protein